MVAIKHHCDLTINKAMYMLVNEVKLKQRNYSVVHFSQLS